MKGRAQTTGVAHGMWSLGTIGRLLSRYWTVLALVLAWALWVRTQQLNQIVAPTPAAVFGDVLGNPGAYAADLGWTLVNATVGLALGMLLGLAGALLVWASPLLSGLMTPMALIMRSVPVVAMIPVIARVVGFGTGAVLTITTVVSFFPAFVMAGSGLRAAPAATRDVFTVLAASRLTRLRLLLLPHAVPSLLVALRLTASTAVLSAMLAEYLLGTHGLGQLFAQSVTFMDPARAWGTALVATVVSVLCFIGARAAERHGTARFS
ncbi:ABC transporter permease subunit [Streptomyces sp. NPDC002896]|uniref:ABC transporter permease n=1 Tax=Streptomyces sp. NPDC002896 TaxID=3154438 RepID=UPI00331CA2C1